MTIDAYRPPEYDADTVYAIRALANGTANEGQQKAALRWVIDHAAKADELGFYPGGEEGRRASDFMQGRRFVGLQVRKMLSPQLNPWLDTQRVKKEAK